MKPFLTSAAVAATIVAGGLIVDGYASAEDALQSILSAKRPKILTCVFHPHAIASIHFNRTDGWSHSSGPTKGRTMSGGPLDVPPPFVIENGVLQERGGNQRYAPYSDDPTRTVFVFDGNRGPNLFVVHWGTMRWTWTVNQSYLDDNFGRRMQVITVASGGECFPR